jgi:SM-20-related protein
MTYLDMQLLEATPIQRDPFDYFIVPGLVRSERLQEVVADFPTVPGPGSHPPDELDIKGHFKALMDELESSEFRTIIERKFGVDLSDKPTMYTVRGFTRQSDGSIHTDSKTKIITVLLYLNQQWEADGGRLRLLRDGQNLDDYVAEVPPDGGTLLVFRRSDNSWHGHQSFAGPRRAIQMNWVTSQKVVEMEQRRHRLSTRIKRLKNLFGRRAG